MFLLQQQKSINTAYNIFGVFIWKILKAHGGRKQQKTLLAQLRTSL